jgi:hypothetical protein
VVEPIFLKSLSEQYARRAREFSDSVALLGRHDSLGPEILKLFKKIKRQRELCSDAEQKLERYIQQDIEDPEAARLNAKHRSKQLTFTARLH